MGYRLLIKQNSLTVTFRDVHYREFRDEMDALLLFVTVADVTQGGLLHQHQLDEAIQVMKQKKLFCGELSEVAVLQTYGQLPYSYVLLVGLGNVSERDSLRAAGVHVARKAMQLQLTRVALALVSPSACGIGPAGEALVEGLLLGTYRAATYRQPAPERAEMRSVLWLAEAAQHLPLQGALRIAQAHAEGTCYARDLTNLPGNKLTPAALVAEAERLAKHHGFAIEVLDAEALAAQGMGGIVGVGQGSANPPYLVTIRYDGDTNSTERLALVGKGITFDTGGISLKQAAGMEDMISDMGGAASVLGTMHILGELRPCHNVIGVIPIAENMPSGLAIKPGDVLHMYNGKTVEIINTDAEGRLILADAVSYAKQLGATQIIDIATLTGAISVALGEWATGAITNDESWYASFQEAARTAGERVWLLPSYPEYRKALASDVADLKNAAKSRSAGAITGALFIGAFAEHTPWIHLDIAGTAYLSSPLGIEPKGATGVMVRTLATWICRTITNDTVRSTGG